MYQNSEKTNHVHIAQVKKHTSAAHRMVFKCIIQLKVFFNYSFSAVEYGYVCITFANINTHKVFLVHFTPQYFFVQNRICQATLALYNPVLYTKLFPNFNLTEGRNCPTVSETKVGTFSSVTKLFYSIFQRTFLILLTYKVMCLFFYSSVIIIDNFAN